MKLMLPIILLFLLSCQESTVPSQATVGTAMERDANASFVTVDFEGLEEYIHNHSAQTLVINFWATWCKPCIKELPAFESLGANYKNKNLSVVLVSLDFPEQLEHLENFIKKKNLQSEIVFLNDGNANEWIPKISENWSGAIPATLIKTKKNKSFHERSFTYSELEKEVQSHSNL